MRCDPFNRCCAWEKEFCGWGAGGERRVLVEAGMVGSDMTGVLWFSPGQQARLRAIFGDDAERFGRAMEAERQMAETRRRVLGGSPTARIEAEQADFAQGVVEDLATGGPRQAVNGALRSEERRVGEKCCSTCGSRWSPDQ